MNKVLFSLLFTFGVFHFNFAQDNLFDDIDDNETPVKEELNQTPLQNYNPTITNWEVDFDEESEENIIVTEQQIPVANWQTTFQEAVTKAKTEKKPILIYFTGSDWCGPCKRLEEEVFSTEKFITLSDENMVLYKADFPRNTDLVSIENQSINKQLSTRYNQTSFPTMIVVNEYGSSLGRKNGMYMTDSYFYFFDDIIRKYKI